MHISVTRPSAMKLRQLIERSAHVSMTQPNPGTTRQWDFDLPNTQGMKTTKRRGKDLVLCKRDRIGMGEAQFEAIAGALKLGKCFDLKWVTPTLLEPAKSGDTFALLVRSFGLWSANLCRIIYVQHHDNYAGRQLIMGIGTLPRHAAIGEERLALQWVKETDEVWFMVDSYSRPNGVLPRLFSRYLRQQQFRFLEQAPERLGQFSDDSPPRVASMV